MAEEDDLTKSMAEAFDDDATPPATPPVEPSAPAPATSPAEPPATPPETPPTPPVTPSVEPPKEEPKSPEEPKKDEKSPPEQPKKEEVIPRAADDKKTEEAAKPPETPATPPAPETPQEPAKPLTKDDVESVVSNLLNTERASGKELEATAQEVLEKYYPDGLSNVLVDEQSGKELRTPQDVVDVSGGQMSTEEAAQWLMNEQYKLDGQVNKIKDDAKAIAETTVSFRRDAVAAVQKYEPLFKAYPVLQQKVFDGLMKHVKVDKEKDVVLSAPDVMEHYDFYLEPYQKAFEFANNKSATNPTPPDKPEPAKPTAEDRMDEGGDGGQSPVDDPNDFAQQVKKELAKGI